jgi:hypothetical protein
MRCDLEEVPCVWIGDLASRFSAIVYFLLNFNMVLPSPTLARNSFGPNWLFAAFGMNPSAPD